MFADNKNPTSAPIPLSYRQELEDLYARRLAIDALIESLQDYDRLCAVRLDARKYAQRSESARRPV